MFHMSNWISNLRSIRKGEKGFENEVLFIFSNSSRNYSKFCLYLWSDSPVPEPNKNKVSSYFSFTKFFSMNDKLPKKSSGTYAITKIMHTKEMKWNTCGSLVKYIWLIKVSSSYSSAGTITIQVKHFYLCIFNN